MRKMESNSPTIRTQSGNINLNTSRITIPPAINFHITERCNYGCRFCFARYGEYRNEISLKDAKKVIDMVAMAGVEKINFAGGEPTLDNRLPNLITHASSHDLFVSLISNGTGITTSLLDECGDHLDMIGLSIDSAKESVERKLGRGFRKSINGLNSQSDSVENGHVTMILEKADLIQRHGIALKINTTITPLNCREDMHPLMETIRPERWKVFEVHRIHGINDHFFENYSIKIPKAKFHSEFMLFIDRHSDLHPVYETSDMMTESYLMITPDGRLHQNTGNVPHYSGPVLKQGFIGALSQVGFSLQKFLARSGGYFRKMNSSASINLGGDSKELPREVKV